MEKAGIKDCRQYMLEVYEFAKAAHAGQTRDSGEAYINHPLGVAGILVDMGLDRTSIAAALLHDVVEDTPVKLEEIREKFGPEVAALRSEERRVGKECRSGWWRYEWKKKEEDRVWVGV